MPLECCGDITRRCISDHIQHCMGVYVSPLRCITNPIWGSRSRLSRPWFSHTCMSKQDSPDEYPTWIIDIFSNVWHDRVSKSAESGLLIDWECHGVSWEG